MTTPVKSEVQKEASREKIKLFFSRIVREITSLSNSLHGSNLNARQKDLIDSLQHIQRGSLFSIPTIQLLSDIYRKLSIAEETNPVLRESVSNVYQAAYRAAEYVEEHGEVEHTPVPD